MNRSLTVRHALRTWLGMIAAVTLLAITVSPAFAQKKSKSPAGADYQGAVNAAYAKLKDLKEGKNADYIPALAEVDPNILDRKSVV